MVDDEVGVASRCTMCEADFLSRNKLFKHLKHKHGVCVKDKGKIEDDAEATANARQPKKNRNGDAFHRPFYCEPSGRWQMPAPQPPPPPKRPVRGEEVVTRHVASRLVDSPACTRTVLCGDSIEWLDSQPALLPERAHIITSLPDISELKLSPAAYEQWFSSRVAALLSRLHPSSVAIFYQTDGRVSGTDRTWLDKGFLATLGARAVGAATVWHRIVNASMPSQVRNGRPGFARLLCFSRAHRCVAAGVDVLPTRGHMSYGAAAGEAAVSAAVQYVLLAHAQERTPPAHAEGEAAPTQAEGKATGEAAAARPLIVGPFCGQGTVLALANAWGCDAMGVDTNRSRCKVATTRIAKNEDEVFDHHGNQIGPIRFWECASNLKKGS